MKPCCDADRVVNLLTDFRKNNYYLIINYLCAIKRTRKPND